MRISDWSSDVCSSDLTLSEVWPRMNAPASGLDIEVDDIFGIDVPGREIIGKDLVCIAGRTAAGDHSFDGSLLIQGEHEPAVAGEGYDLTPAGRSGVAVLVVVNRSEESR